MIKVAYIISHPIQHFCPMFAEWARVDCWKLKVLFASTAGMSSYYDTNFGKEIKWDGLRLEEFDHVFLNKDENIHVDNKIDAANLSIELDAFKPHVIVVLGYAQKLQRRAMNWAKESGTKVLLFSDAENRSKKDVLKGLLKYFLLKSYFKNVDGFLVTGNANEEYYRKYGGKPDQMFKCTFPINVRLYEEAYGKFDDLKNSVRSKYNIPDDAVVCTVVGKLVKRKCQADLIKAINFIKSTRVVILIVGSGTDESELKKIASSTEAGRVIFTGFITANNLPAIYAATDIYVHPAFLEPHSLAISEAIYMRCATIVSDTTGSYGTNDDVKIGLNGFVYKQGNIKQLASRIDDLANNENLLKAFKDESRLYSLESQSIANSKGLKAALVGIGLLK